MMVNVISSFIKITENAAMYTTATKSRDRYHRQKEGEIIPRDNCGLNFSLSVVGLRKKALSSRTIN